MYLNWVLCPPLFLEILYHTTKDATWEVHFGHLTYFHILMFSGSHISWTVIITFVLLPAGLFSVFLLFHFGHGRQSSSILARFYGSSSPPVRKLRNINTNEFDPERDTYILVSTSPNMASNHFHLTKQFTRWRDMQLIICFWEFEKSSVFAITTLSSSIFFFFFPILISNWTVNTDPSEAWFQ